MHVNAASFETMQMKFPWQNWYICYKFPNLHHSQKEINCFLWQAHRQIN